MFFLVTCFFLSLQNNEILKFSLMGYLGNWLKSLIWHKSAHIKDHVSSNLCFDYVLVVFFFFFFLGGVLILVYFVCFRRRVVVTGRENGGCGGALRGVQG